MSGHLAFENPNLRSVKVYTVPLPVSINHLYGTGKGGRRYLTDRAKVWATEAALCLRAQGFSAPLGDRYCVGLHVFFPDRRRADIDNVLKQTLDLVAKEAGIDDSQVWSLMVEKGIDRVRPRIDLKVSVYAYPG